MDVSGQLHDFPAFTPGERAPGTHWVGVWVGPTASLDAWRKEKSCTAWNRTRAAQPAACRYADWDALARSPKQHFVKEENIFYINPKRESGWVLRRDFFHERCTRNNLRNDLPERAPVLTEVIVFIVTYNKRHTQHQTMNKQPWNADFPSITRSCGTDVS
jgi:hypothetical protein